MKGIYQCQSAQKAMERQCPLYRQSIDSSQARVILANWNSLNNQCNNFPHFLQLTNADREIKALGYRPQKRVDRTWGDR